MNKSMQKQSFGPDMGSENSCEAVAPGLVELSEQETDQVGGGPEVENSPSDH